MKKRNNKEETNQNDINMFSNKTFVLDAMEMLKKLPDKSIDMILTDIPYNEVNRESN
jgi:DNA modification methylase